MTNKISVFVICGIFNDSEWKFVHRVTAKNKLQIKKDLHMSLSYHQDIGYYDKLIECQRGKSVQEG